MADIMNELRNVYLDFFGLDNGKMPDDEKVKNTLLGDMKDPLLSGLDTNTNINEQLLKTREALRESGRNTLDALNAFEAVQRSTGMDKYEAQNAQTAVQSEKPAEKKPEKPAMDELNELIGLTSIKHDVVEMVALAKVRKLREDRGMKAVPISLHLVFSGNPGTGKTTVARILARLYQEIGILSKGQLIETDRSGLVAGYLGQTAIKTQKLIQEAIGGILFIDEAYALSQKDDQFGQESIDTILKAMEDHRDDFIVIVAGYTEPMKKFIESNPGLKSRFNKYFEFPDYTSEELKGIFDMQCKKYQYVLTDEANEKAHTVIAEMEANKGSNFANARSVRNYFESIVANQAARVAEIKDPSEEDITTITADDLNDIEIKELSEKEKVTPEEMNSAADDLINSLEALADSCKKDEPEDGIEEKPEEAYPDN